MCRSRRVGKGREVRHWHYLRHRYFAVAVAVDRHGVIRNAPPIVYRFRGQHLETLVALMQKEPGFVHRELPRPVPGWGQWPLPREFVFAEEERS